MTELHKCIYCANLNKIPEKGGINFKINIVNEFLSISTYMNGVRQGLD